MTWTVGLLGLLAGLLIATLTTPVGVSGAVFLLPVQLSVLGVPSPAVTPTNLLFNVVSGPGALLRYRRDGNLFGPLTRQLVTGTLPGVVLGAVIRAYVVPGPRVFRLIVAAVLLPVSLWLFARTLRPGTHHSHSAPSRRSLTVLALIVGVVGGIYGIGGGSILGPILAGRGIPISKLAPAALVSTFLTSIIGAGTYGLLSLATNGTAPDWPLGLLCGLGGYLGAWLQPYLPEKTLRLLLATVAFALSALYITQALS